MVCFGGDGVKKSLKSSNREALEVIEDEMGIIGVENAESTDAVAEWFDLDEGDVIKSENSSSSSIVG